MSTCRTNGRTGAAAEAQAAAAAMFDNTKPLHYDDAGSASIAAAMDTGVTQAKATNANAWQSYFTPFEGTGSAGTTGQDTCSAAAPAEETSAAAAQPQAPVEQRLGAKDIRVKAIGDSGAAVHYDGLVTNVSWMGTTLTKVNLGSAEISGAGGDGEDDRTKISSPPPTESQLPDSAFGAPLGTPRKTNKVVPTMSVTTDSSADDITVKDGIVVNLRRPK